MIIRGMVFQQVRRWNWELDLVNFAVKVSLTMTCLATGTPSEDNCYADIEAAFNYLVKEKGISPHQIVLYGRSVGSGPSCWLARKTALNGNSVGGLILHSPFASVYRVVLNFGFTVIGDKFPNIDNIKDVSCPVFICHGGHGEQAVRQVYAFFRGKNATERNPHQHFLIIQYF